MKRSESVRRAGRDGEGDRRDRARHVVGRIAWDGANLPPFAAKNIAKTPLVGGQWRLKEGNKYDIVIVDNKTFPAIPVAGKMEPIQ